MKVVELSKKDYVILSEMIEHPNTWSALRHLLENRQLELAMEASMQQDMEGLRKAQGKIEESRWLIDQLKEIHKRHRNVKPI